MEHLLYSGEDDVLHVITFNNSINFEDLDFYFFTNGYEKTSKFFVQSCKIFSHDEMIYKTHLNFYSIRKLLKKINYGNTLYTCVKHRFCEKVDYDKKSPLSQQSVVGNRIVYTRDDHDFRFVIEKDTWKLEFNSIKNFEQVFYNIYNMFGDVVNDYKKLTNYNGFAGSMPGTYEGKSLRGYSVTAKADGLRYNIFVDKYGKFNLIDRNLNVITIENICKPKFSNTIIDCEKVGDNYYCFDIMFSCNENIGNDNLGKRLNRLDEIITKIDDKRFKVKTFYIHFTKTNEVKEFPGNKNTNFETIYDAIKYVWENKNDYEFNVDGLVFTYSFSRFYNKGTFKWKNEHTIDLEIEKVDNKTHLYSYDDEKILFATMDYIGHDSGIGEFIYKHDGSLEFKQIRKDKHCSNILSTIKNIQRSVERNITIETFMNKKSQLTSNEQRKETSSFGKRT